MGETCQETLLGSGKISPIPKTPEKKVCRATSLQVLSLQGALSTVLKPYCDSLCWGPAQTYPHLSYSKCCGGVDGNA